MSRQKNSRTGVGAIYAFAFSWLLLSLIVPLYKVWGLLLTLGVCCFVSFLAGRGSAKKRKAAQEAERREAEKKAAQTPASKKSSRR